MRIALVTAWDELYADIAGLTAPIMHLYCLRHGYDFLPFKNRFHLSIERDPSLLTYGDRAKIQIYKDYYSQYDAIAWLDIDTVITNLEVKLEDLLGGRPFLWTYGPSGPLSGFTIARTTPRVHLALHAVQHWAAEQKGPDAPGGRSDQDGMRHFLKVPPFDEVFENIVSCKDAGHCMPFSVYGWNEYAWLGDWERGDFLFTVPSLPVPARLKMLTECKEAVYDA